MRDLLQLLGSCCYTAITHKISLLAIGGAVGTIARYSLTQRLSDVAWSRGFPLGTFAINVTGSFILGILAVVIMERLPSTHHPWFLLFGTGFCGGYTTFSTFEWETYKLVRDGSHWLAIANVFGSVIIGFLGVIVAVALAGLMFPKQ